MTRCRFTTFLAVPAAIPLTALAVAAAASGTASTAYIALSGWRF
jgi:hypothetical protein